MDNRQQSALLNQAAPTRRRVPWPIHARRRRKILVCVFSGGVVALASCQLFSSGARRDCLPVRIALSPLFLGHSTARLSQCTRGRIEWTSDDTLVVTVDDQGQVTGRSDGTAVVRAIGAERTESTTVVVATSSDTGLVQIAHRGYAGQNPENTIPAMLASIAASADAIELDLRHTRDGAVVLMHDPTVDRTTNGSGVVQEMTLDQVRQLDACAKFADARPPCVVPTLAEVLALGRSHGTRLLLHLKEPFSSEQVTDLLNAIAAARMDRKVAVISTDTVTLRRFRSAHSGVPVGYLVSSAVRSDDVASLRPLIVLYYLPVLLAGISRPQVDSLRSAGIDVGTWTITDEQQVPRILAIEPIIPIRIISDIHLRR